MKLNSKLKRSETMLHIMGPKQRILQRSGTILGKFGKKKKKKCVFVCIPKTRKTNSKNIFWFVNFELSSLVNTLNSFYKILTIGSKKFQRITVETE